MYKSAMVNGNGNNTNGVPSPKTGRVKIAIAGHDSGKSMDLAGLEALSPDNNTTTNNNNSNNKEAAWHNSTKSLGNSTSNLEYVMMHGSTKSLIHVEVDREILVDDDVNADPKSGMVGKSIIRVTKDKETPKGRYVNRSSISMKDFLENRKLDKNTEELLLKYDEHGYGIFSKDKVAMIIQDLQQEVDQNQVLAVSNIFIKRLLFATILFCILLLAGMFGLSFAVAAITRQTMVDQQGQMKTKDGSRVVATDSIANTIVDIGNHEGKFCVPADQSALITQNVAEGRNVLLKLGDSVSGNSTVNRLQPDGMQVHADGTVCFWNAAVNDYSCLIPATDGCVATDSSGRRLEHRGTGYPDLQLAVEELGCQMYPHCAEVCGCHEFAGCLCYIEGFDGSACADYIGNFECPNDPDDSNSNYFYCEAGTKC